VGRHRHSARVVCQLLTDAGIQVHQMRALLECVWPARLAYGAQRFAPLLDRGDERVADRDVGDLTRPGGWGVARLESAVRREIIRP